jgi:hypothetical protein
MLNLVVLSCHQITKVKEKLIVALLRRSKSVPDDFIEPKMLRIGFKSHLKAIEIKMGPKAPILFLWRERDSKFIL